MHKVILFLIWIDEKNPSMGGVTIYGERVPMGGVPLRGVSLLFAESVPLWDVCSFGK